MYCLSREPCSSVLLPFGTSFDLRLRQAGDIAEVLLHVRTEAPLEDDWLAVGNAVHCFSFGVDQLLERCLIGSEQQEKAVNVATLIQ